MINEYNRMWYHSHGDLVRKTARKYYQTHKKERLAKNKLWRSKPDVKAYLKDYMNLWRAKNPDKVRANTKRNYWKHHERNRVYDKSYRMRGRDILFEMLGGAFCKSCGFDNKVALQIDHVNSGGTKERRRFGHGDVMLRYYREHPEEAKRKLQVLCANCNWIKKMRSHEDKHTYNPIELKHG